LESADSKIRVRYGAGFGFPATKVTSTSARIWPAEIRTRSPTLHMCNASNHVFPTRWTNAKRASLLPLVKPFACERFAVRQCGQCARPACLPAFCICAGDAGHVWSPQPVSMSLKEHCSLRLSIQSALDRPQSVSMSLNRFVRLRVSFLFAVEPCGHSFRRRLPCWRCRLPSCSCRVHGSETGFPVETLDSVCSR